MAAPPAEAPWTTDPEVDKYLSELPSGYRFRPTDGELVVDYLRNKILEVPMPLNRIRTFKIYDFHPFELYRMYGATPRENACYFFTTRKKKYPKGKRTARTAGEGFWKSTTGDLAVVVGDTTVGWKRSLVYHQGPASDSVKTDWLMQEYTLNYNSLPTPITKRAHDCVLSFISLVSFGLHQFASVLQYQFHNPSASSGHTDPINGGEFHEDSRQDSPFKGCMTPEVPRHDASIRRSEYREGLRHNTPNHLDLSHDSPCTRGGSYEGLKHDDIHANHGSEYNSFVIGGSLHIFSTSGIDNLLCIISTGLFF
ncbi:hypothetical protein DM860_010557 [Cuscuta australis]|uniref:NAC domain-containing protein n=1 Tax=Cuscuta australis TaxID=267555 RepID=A0A328E5G6_9ASTE|nr:hypothetical protein DM860_010557 [Cuscuta australis]